jgi:hypothetical protein
MITYSALYEVGKRPLIRKTVEAIDGSMIDTGINFYNEEEREFLTDEIIQQHLLNLHTYFKDLSSLSTLMPTGTPLTTYIIPEWDSLNEIFQEMNAWWNLITFRPEIDEPHDDSLHSHDPETGEEIPNA